MRAVVQRVSKASVHVEGEVVGAIGPGLVILIGIGQGDTESEAVWLADKISHLRIFENEAGKFDLSLLDVQGQALIVSQFTLYGDASRGRRPSFSDAARPESAEPLYERFVELVRAQGVPVETGVFQAMMAVEIHNDGPVTLVLER
jgi:D-tyrosyl-tRNA(Tyr) deacylase